jgi:hypothetical protein
MNPTDPFTDLSVGLIGMHELMLEAMNAGFTREEAFRIVLEMLLETIRGAK